MHAARPTDPTHGHDQPGRTEPRLSRRTTAAALAIGTAAIGAGAVAATTPVLAFVSANHNETVLRSPAPSPRTGTKATAAIGGVAIAVGTTVAVSSTPVVAFITASHNETVLRSPGRS